MALLAFVNDRFNQHGLVGGVHLLFYGSVVFFWNFLFGVLVGVRIVSLGWFTEQFLVYCWILFCSTKFREKALSLSN